jgi:short-subunit dehydrogenase
MPKKMARLDESKDYRPFKFRIQSFSNGFQEELSRRGITEETITPKKLKHYLWRQDLISRFNDEGKKAKSKGNHVWNILAKKLPDGSWVFKPYSRTIIVQPQPFA